MPAIDTKMTPNQHQKIIHELQDVITQTIELMDRFEAKGLQEILGQDYEQLHNLLAKATKQQRLHMQALINSQKPNKTD